MHKPPLAPKPKLTELQRPGLSPSTPRRGGVLSLPSPGTPRRDKPVLAPKPCLSKLSTAVESKPLASKSLHQTSVTESPRTKGLLNSHNGIQQENKKPDWDYIIPICLCSHENCVCIRNTSLNLDKTEKDLLHRGRNEENKKLLPPPRDTLDNSGDKMITNNKPLRETFALDKNLNTDVNMATVRPSLPHRTWSDEANGNVIPHSAPGRGPEEDALGSEHKSCAPQPKAASPRKPVPVPVPRKPRMAVLTRQEKVEEEEGEEVTSQEGRDVNAKEVKVPSGAEKQPIILSARKACAMPAPPPRKKPFLSAPEKAPTSAPRTLAEDVEEEDLGWDSISNEMEVSVDKEDEEVEKEGTHDQDQEDVYTDFSHSPPSISQPPAVTVAAEGVVVKVAPKKPQRHSSPMAWMLTRELPAPPAEKVSRNVLTVGALKPSRSSKQRAKSFTAADLIRSEGQKRNSFRKLLDLKLSVKMLPKLMVKGGSQIPDRAANGHDQSTDRDQDVCQKSEHLRAERKLSCPQIGVEQSVDGEEISYYENIPHYEEIPDYMNVQAGTDLTSPPAAFLPQTAWQSSLYNDEGIYEEQEPYMSFEKNSGQEQQCETPTDCERQSGQKKSKIQHIATEIMSSESSNSLKKTSRQSGKPVIEERLLNQILYSLPQLYELNQDLLRELKQRVANWDDSAQLADIFLKKGPYLKMYSTYIREYDKNVAVLEEQSKKNPAFGAVVREFEASPRCANLALRHYLLKPVQRIPQYQLLLTDYLKNLSEDSEDYKDTQAALAIVKEVANHANDIMKQGDNFQKLIQVQCSLNGQHEIVQPGRIFLKEGILKKLSRKVMQPRMFFLFNDTLLYTTPVQSGQYKFNNMLSLAGMKVSKPSQEAYQNELNIESVERSFILSASSAAERDNWLEAISTAISDYTRKKISFIPELNYCDDGAPLGSKAPIWIPDPRTTMCMICTCEFTLTWRRHHCRACGKVVCQSCSSNKHQLEYLKNQLARVCDQCVLVLQQQKTVSPGNRATFAFSRKQKKIPAALKEVSANTDSSMSGYLQRSKGNKKQGKRLWFVIKDKVLYTYAASEDVAALESQPLLGFMLKVDSSQKLQFKLYHKNTLYYIFKADDIQTAQRWIDSFKEATVL
uniref:FYVE, RhoGEF and PH domain containing 6 n=1 Tax=Sparus aurata TaxID=8175 RepID=A0A671XZH5_SPAAU